MSKVEKMNGHGTEVPERAQRRRFTAEYKARILREVDACKHPGEKGRCCAGKGCIPLT